MTVEEPEWNVVQNSDIKPAKMPEEQKLSASHVEATNDWTTPIKDTVYKYTGVGEPTKTDRQQDWDSVSFVMEQHKKGIPLADIYSLSENPAKTKGLYAKYLKTQFPDEDEFQIAERAGASYSNAKRVHSGNYEDFQTGMAQYVADTSVGLNKLVGRNPQGLDKLESFSKGVDENRDYTQAYTATYDKNGARNIDLQQLEGMGNMVPSAAMSMAGGAVAKSAGAALGFDLVQAGAETTIEHAAKSNGDWTTYPAKLAMNMAASLAGGLLFPNTPIKDNTYNAEQLTELAEGMKLMDGLNLPLSKEMLDNPELIKKKINEAYKNPWDREQALAAVNNLNASVVNKVKMIANSVGATPQQLIDFRAGRISSREIGKKFQDFTEGQALVKQSEVNKLRESMKTMDLDEAGNPRKYKLGEVDSEGSMTGWLSDIMREAEENDTVYNYLKRQIKHRGQIEGDESKAATAMINTHATINEGLQKSRGNLQKSLQDLKIEQVRLSEYTDKTGSATIMRTKQKIKDLNGNIKASRLAIKDGEKELGASLSQFRKFKAENGSLVDGDWSAAKVVEDMTEFTAIDMENLFKSINHKINVGGGAISTEDKTQMALLRRIKSKMQTKMENTIEDPNFMTTKATSNKLTREKYNLTTDQGGIKGLSAAHDSPNPEDFTRLFTSDSDGVSNLKHFKEMNGGNYTEEYNEMLNKVYSGKVLKGVENVGDYNMNMNFDQLAKNINDPDFIPNLMELATPEVVDSFKQMRGLVNAYGSVFKQISENSAQMMGSDKGWAAKLGELMEFIGSPMQGVRTAQKKIWSGPYDKAQKALGRQDRMFWYDEEAKFGEAIKSTLERIDGIEKPADKKALLDLTVTQFMKRMVNKQTKMRAGGIAGTEKDLPATVNIEKWARGSDVEDVYHGTPNEIKAFDNSKGTESVHNVEGTYSTIYPEDANTYAKKTTPEKGAPNIMPLKARNEKMLSVQNTEVGEGVARQFDLPDYKLWEIERLGEKGFPIGALLRASNDKKLNTKILKSLGYTGLVDGPHRVHFNPNDLKSRYSKGFSLDSNDVALGTAGVAAFGAASQIEEGKDK